MGNIRRRFFFWIERLNITRGERRFVVTAIITSLTIWLADGFVAPSKPPYNDTFYQPLDSLYARYVQHIHTRDSLIHHYYYTAVDSPKNIAHGVPFAIPGDVSISSAEKQRVQKSAPPRHSIDINRADSAALVTLPGIGPIIAGKIIDYRNTHGPFRDLNSLKKVSGIGEKKLQHVRPFLKLKTNKTRK